MQGFILLKIFLKNGNRLLRSDILETNYYSIQNYFLDFFDENSRKFGFFGTTKDELISWQKDMRVKLSKLLGTDKMIKCELNPKMIESEKFDGYTRDKIVIETQPKVFMPLFILTPDNGNGIPVIAVHGHASDGKNGLVGIINDMTREKIESYNYTYALDLVEEGYTVFCPDLCGSGERREPRQQGESCILESSCDDINNAAMCFGMSVLGLMVFDLMRLIDYIIEKEDNKEIACCGFSGGALCTLWLAAIDERVKCAAVSGYFHGLKDTILDNNLCGCNFVPDMWRYIDICDLGSMIAPRPLLIESGNEDKLNGKRKLNNVFEQVFETRKAYDLFENQNFVHTIFDGGHKWYGSAYNFLRDWSDSFE